MKDKLLISAITACAMGSIACMVFAWLSRGTATDLEVLPDPLQRICSIRQGTTTKVDYTLRNRTSVPIRIIQVLSSCNCAGVDLTTRHLEPDESVLATLTFDSGQYRGSVHTSAVLIYSMHGEDGSRHLKIGLLAEIDPDYDVVPRATSVRARYPIDSASNTFSASRLRLPDRQGRMHLEVL